MMRSILVLLLFVMGTSISAQGWYIDEDNELQLWGTITVDDMKKAPYKDWYDFSQKSYAPIVNMDVAADLKGVSVLVYMGTWCSDSQDWVPKFMKLWEAMELPSSHVKIVAVHNGADKYKQAPDRSEEFYNIEKVPTFIFMKGEMELGRIIEYPEISLEMDIARIVNGTVMKPKN
jgi:hypothetical protein